MPRIAKVSDIKANLLRPATTSHFEVDIPIPNALRDKWQGVGKQDKINLMCSETVLPGSNLATFEINNDRTGVTERHVHRRIFDDRIDLTFYIDAGLYQPIKFFEFLDASNRPILSSILKSLLCQNIDRNFVILDSRFDML